MRPCGHQTSRPGCPACKWCESRTEKGRRYRRLWGEPEPQVVPAIGPCRHLGGPTGETVTCPSCRGTVKLKLFSCGVHGTCTKEKQVDGHGCCAGCPQKAASLITTRNLIYHVGPFAGNGVWQRNVMQILKRIDLFNGRRVVAILTGPGMDPPERVVDAFAGHVHDFVVTPNDAGLREVATFLPMLERVYTLSPHEATFSAHAKGVTRPVNDGVTVHRWTDLMYETCLDYWPLVGRLLETSPMAGSFKKVGAGFDGSASSWHYSGTFYWFRNADLFARDWERVDQVWWGTESYPGVQFGVDEGATIFREGTVPELDLYDFAFFRDSILPDYERWKQEHAHERTTARG